MPWRWAWQPTQSNSCLSRVVCLHGMRRSGLLREVRAPLAFEGSELSRAAPLRALGSACAKDEASGW